MSNKAEFNETARIVCCMNLDELGMILELTLHAIEKRETERKVRIHEEEEWRMLQKFGVEP
jgi:transposase